MTITNNHAYPDIGQMKLPWAASLSGALWHKLSDDRKAKAKIVVGAGYRELYKRRED